MGNVVSVAIRAQGVNQTNQAIDSVGTHLDGLNKTVSVIGAGVGALGVAFLGATTMFARGAFQAATAMEMQKVGFTSLMGSATKATEVMKKLYKFAAVTPFEFPEVATWGKQLLAMGYQVDQLIPVLTSLGDAISSVGGRGETMSRVMLNMAQMISQGKLTGGDMRQIAIAMPGIQINKLVAKELGMTMKEYQKAMSKGAIEATRGIEALVRGLSKVGKGGMEMASKTMLGLMSTLKDTWRSFLTNPDGTGAGDKMGAKIKPILEDLLAKAQKLERDGTLERWSTSVGRALAALADQFAKVVRFIADHPKMVEIGVKIAAWGGAMSALAIPIFTLTTGIKGIATAWDMVASAAGAAAKAQAAAAGAGAVAGGAAGAGMNWWQRAGASAGAAWVGVRTFTKATLGRIGLVGRSAGSALARGGVSPLSAMNAGLAYETYKTFVDEYRGGKSRDESDKQLDAELKKNGWKGGLQEFKETVFGDRGELAQLAKTATQQGKKNRVPLVPKFRYVPESRSLTTKLLQSVTNIPTPSGELAKRVPDGKGLDTSFYIGIARKYGDPSKRQALYDYYTGVKVWDEVKDIIGGKEPVPTAKSDMFSPGKKTPEESGASSSKAKGDARQAASRKAQADRETYLHNLRAIQDAEEDARLEELRESATTPMESLKARNEALRTQASRNIRDLRDLGMPEKTLTSAIKQIEKTLQASLSASWRDYYRELDNMAQDSAEKQRKLDEARLERANQNRNESLELEKTLLDIRLQRSKEGRGITDEDIQAVKDYQSRWLALNMIGMSWLQILRQIAVFDNEIAELTKEIADSVKASKDAAHQALIEKKQDQISELDMALSLAENDKERLKITQDRIIAERELLRLQGKAESNVQKKKWRSELDVYNEKLQEEKRYQETRKDIAKAADEEIMASFSDRLAGALFGDTKNFFKQWAQDIKAILKQALAGTILNSLRHLRNKGKGESGGETDNPGLMDILGPSLGIQNASMGGIFEGGQYKAISITATNVMVSSNGMSGGGLINNIAQQFGLGGNGNNGGFQFMNAGGGGFNGGLPPGVGMDPYGMLTLPGGTSGGFPSNTGMVPVPGVPGGFLPMPGGIPGIVGSAPQKGLFGGQGPFGLNMGMAIGKSSLGGVLGMGMLGYSLAPMLFGKNNRSDIGGGLGSALGMALGGPLGALAGGLLGGALGSLFKKKKKFNPNKTWGIGEDSLFGRGNYSLSTPGSSSGGSGWGDWASRRDEDPLLKMGRVHQQLSYNVHNYTATNLDGFDRDFARRIKRTVR